MCCEFLELQLAAPLSGDTMRWAALHDGVSIVERDGATFVHLDIICGALTMEGGCALHGTPDRPRMCEGWPYGNPVLHQAPEGCVFLDEFRLNEVQSKGLTLDMPTV
jgi:hypothetical protein